MLHPLLKTICVALLKFSLVQVLERAVTHVDNVYHFPVSRVRGRLCKTNLPSNTAFRGFGGPQAMVICENFMTEIADKLGLPQEKVLKVCEIVLR